MVQQGEDVGEWHSLFGGGLEVEVDVGQNIEQVVSAEWMGATNFANIPILDAFWTFNFFPVTLVIRLTSA